MTNAEQWPVLRSLDEKTLQGIVRELGMKFKEHDPLIDRSDDKALYATLGARSVVNWIRKEFIEPRAPEQPVTPSYDDKW